MRWRQSFAVGGYRERGGGEKSKAWLLMGEKAAVQSAILLAVAP